MTTGITIAFITVVLYTITGGLLADVFTDFIQGIAVILGLLALFVFIIATTGNPVSTLSQVDPQRFSLMGPDQSLLEFVEQWTIPICGSLVAIELISRLLACRTPAISQRACYLGGGGYLLVALIPVYLGLIGASLVPDLDHSEQFIPELAQKHLPTLLYVIFAGALISAILSTVDSALLACSSMLSHNIVQHIWTVDSDRARVWLARFGVAGLGTLAFVLALTSEGIGDLVELASAFGTAGVFVVTAFALFTRFGGAASAYAAMATGALVWVVSGPLMLGFPAPYTFAVAAAAVAYPLAALYESRKLRTFGGS